VHFPLAAACPIGHSGFVPASTDLLAARDAAYDLSDAALAAWRGRDDIGTPAWWTEKRNVAALCRTSAEAQQAVYDAGLEYAPYWWVRPGYNPAARLAAA
jgi:hypothetical protein